MDFNAILERREKAQNVVSNMCNGDHKWLMSIPCDEKRDSDILICNSLRDINKLIEELQSKKYPHNWTKEQWRKWVACEAMKGMIVMGTFSEESTIENAYEFADAFLKEGDKDD